MRIVAPCVICAELEKTKDPKKLTFVTGELDETGVIYLECDKGHKSAVMYDARRYEVLLRSGGKALLSGHPNESIASFSAALERAYEFYIRVVCRARNIDKNNLEKAWKTVSSQSERQFGAFNFIYLIQENSLLELNPKIPEIRNKVIHKGKITRDKEAREFAELVYKRIRSIEKALEPFARAVEEESKNELEIQEKSIPKGMKSGRLKITTAMVDNNGKVTSGAEKFSDYLIALQKSIANGLA